MQIFTNISEAAVVKKIKKKDLLSFSVYRQGDIGTSWYAVLSGSLDVKISETSSHQVSVIFFLMGWLVKAALLFLACNKHSSLIYLTVGKIPLASFSYLFLWQSLRDCQLCRTKNSPGVEEFKSSHRLSILFAMWAVKSISLTIMGDIKGF